MKRSTKLKIQTKKNLSRTKKPTEDQNVSFGNSGSEDDTNSAKRSRYNFRHGLKGVNANKRPSKGGNFDNKSLSSPAVVYTGSNTSHRFVPVSSLPPGQAAFSIDSIRKLILSYSSPQDLLRFRLVSLDWLRDATNDTLLKWTTISFKKGQSDSYFYWQSSKWDGQLKKHLPSPLTLHHLTEVMNVTGLKRFPCSKFSISYSDRNDGDMELESFLNNHGVRIKYLDLKLAYYKTCQVNDNNHFLIRFPCFHSEIWVIEFIKNVLKLAPNLVELQIMFAGQKSGNDNIACTTFPTNSSVPPPFVHQNLLSVSLNLGVGSVSRVINGICELAPNLKILKDYHLNHYFEPKNRLHLLKNLNYSLTFFNFSNNNNIFNTIANAEREPQLEEFRIETEKLFKHREYWPQMSDNLNKIFRKSCHSLKKLHLTAVGFLHGLEIPEMANVKYISFKADFQVACNKTTFFPEGLLILKTFPKLNTVQLYNGMFTNVFKKRIFCFSFQEEVIPSVKFVIKSPTGINLSGFRRWFPNAMIIEDNSSVNYICI